MPRNLEPSQIALPARIARGAIVALPDPKAGDTAKDKAEILRFQYNPETVTRTRTGQWEHRLDKKVEPKPAQRQKEMNSHRGGGLKAKSEMISMKLVFDASELAMRGEDQRDLLITGVLPELAVLERIALGPDQKPEPKKEESEFPLISLNPSEVLFVLGPRRFPAVITSLSIVEQRFNAELVPVRAEVEVRLRVLEATVNAANKLIAKTFDELLKARARSAAAAAEIVSGDLEQAIAAALDPTKTNRGAGE